MKTEELLRASARMTAGSLVALMLTLSSACQREKAAASPETEEFHADNDIAMTVRSVSDAFQIHEELTSGDYNFEGVLTDGEGAPLYTDIMGSPGQWGIEVLSPYMLRIHNLYLGDLLPANLEQYIVDTLELGVALRIEPAQQEGDADISEYELPSGLLRFETRIAKAANGTEGPLVNILLIGIHDADSGRGTPDRKAMELVDAPFGSPKRLQ